MPTVTELVETCLKADGHDGLFRADIPCGCEIGDLFPCGESGGGCRPAVKVFCGDCESRGTEECEYGDDSIDNWCMFAGASGGGPLTKLQERAGVARANRRAYEAQVESDARACIKAARQMIMQIASALAEEDGAVLKTSGAVRRGSELVARLAEQCMEDWRRYEQAEEMSRVLSKQLEEFGDHG